MSEQFISSEMLWWDPPIEEESFPAANLLLPQYYLVSPTSSIVNEMPGAVTDFFIQSSTPLLETNFNEFGIPSPPSTLNESNTISSNNQSSRRRSRRRSSLEEEARITRRRERNRLAARRSRIRSRNYYNQLEQRVVELEAEITMLRGLLDRESPNE
ncbi:hypothetical protein C1645_765635, partial [Glomus cerebriforme]